MTPHLTEECKRVIAEKAIETFDLFFDKIEEKEKKKVLSFVERQLDSSRITLRTKAADFLKNGAKHPVFGRVAKEWVLLAQHHRWQQARVAGYCKKSE